jgi:TonB family protein
MSTIEPDDRFVSEEELNALLEKWQSPQPSAALNERITSSYLREISQASVLSNPVELPKTDNEVVKMKFCSVCEEEFADKFSFCPVDATPLSPMVRAEEPSVTAIPSNGGGMVLSSEPEPLMAASVSASSSALVPRGEYHLTIMNDAGLASRLGGEIKDVAHEYELTWPEFKRDPIGFVKRSIVGYGQVLKRFLANRNVVVAMSVAVIALIALSAIVLLLDKSNSAKTGKIGIIAFGVVAFGILVAMFATWLGKDRGAAVMGAQASDSQSVAIGMVAAFLFIFAVLGGLFWLELKPPKDSNLLVAENGEVVDQIIDIPQEQPTPDPGPAGFNKGSGGGSKPKQERPGGGGGGGRQEATPASAGKLPQASLDVPQILPPDPKPPVVKNPSLPVAATVNADPLLVPPDARVLPYGDPKSRSTTPSSGPGSGNGIGSGTGTGVGSGEGNGVGPGRGGNIGGGDYNRGGGGPGGGGGGDYSRVFSGKEVTSKARVLSKPEPQYTEEARKNQIVGTVLLQAVFSASGEVTQIRALRPLPYGLTEKAIAAARMIKFVPAMKDGHAVSMYMHLEYNFNLY